MWICPRCHAENRDSAAACESCGAVRAAGRFGSGAPEQQSARAPRAPRVTPAAETAPLRRRTPERYQPPETQVRPRMQKRPFSGLGRMVGGLLLALLPLLTALLAWRQHDALAAALLPLLLDEAAGDGVRMAVYIALALTAVLVAALPGLWTLLLSGKPPKRPRE